MAPFGLMGISLTAARTLTGRVTIGAIALVLFLFGTGVSCLAQTPKPPFEGAYQNRPVIFEPDSFRLTTCGFMSISKTWPAGTDPMEMKNACDATVRDLLADGWIIANEEVDKNGKHFWEMRKPNP